MSHQNKIKKMIIKIPRHPFIIDQSNVNYQENISLRKCRVNLERINGQQAPSAGGGGGLSFPLKAKPKRCCVRVARLPNVERNELSVTPASSIVCSDFDDDSAAE
ncbi:uncharacterized protein LOC6556433 [Drosophila grimshawi]|uniref:uncharacterized protein LOC6556433 n=1 Tax=Drosophila grimshawi TaxID=7222 RepID=UPI000C86F05D|nr:uncharacterized protein LOC6556433 [Drosophila grimshawi]